MTRQTILPFTRVVQIPHLSSSAVDLPRTSGNTDGRVGSNYISVEAVSGTDLTGYFWVQPFDRTTKRVPAYYHAAGGQDSADPSATYLTASSTDASGAAGFCAGGGTILTLNMPSAKTLESVNITNRLGAIAQFIINYGVIQVANPMRDAHLEPGK